MEGEEELVGWFVCLLLGFLDVFRKCLSVCFSKVAGV